MKKKVGIALLVVLCVVMTACQKKEKIATREELENLQEKITDYVAQNNVQYTNVSSCYIDEEQKLVVVELSDNSEKQQQWFKDHIVDSKYLKFIQGGPYTVSFEKLTEVNNKIVAYFSKENVEYKNLSFHYIDLTNQKIVVGLFENTEEQQKKFKELVVDYDFLVFVQGEALKNLSDYNHQG